MDNRGISALAQVLTERMKQANIADAITDLGTIGKNGYLTTDALQVAMEPEDYFIIDSGYEPREGDRVLVAWVTPEPVVVGKIRRGSQ